MRQQRTFEEFFIDEALTLSLLAEHEAQVGAVRMDRLRLQKLVFLVTYAWFDQRWKGFNYSFFRYRRGPFCRDLYLTEVDLASAGLVNCGPMWSMSLTDSGKEWAEELTESVWNTPVNTRFWDSLVSLIRRYATVPTSELVTSVYEMKVVPLGWRESVSIDEVPQGIDLTRILEEDEAESAIEVEPEWLESIAYLMTTQVEQEDCIPSYAI